MKRAAASYAYVAAQIVVMAYLFLSGPLFLRNAVGRVLAVGGVALGVWAVASLGIRRLSPFPDILPHADLTTLGPYRWVRHPLYAAVLLVTGGLVWERPEAVRVVAWAVLAALLVWKLRYEERLLAAAFPDYDDYAKKTWRLVPFLY